MAGISAAPWGCQDLAPCHLFPSLFNTTNWHFVIIYVFSFFVFVMLSTDACDAMSMTCVTVCVWCKWFLFFLGWVRVIVTFLPQTWSLHILFMFSCPNSITCCWSTSSIMIMTPGSSSHLPTGQLSEQEKISKGSGRCIQTHYSKL